MRRISHLTKEAFCWSRAQVVGSRERLEHWEQVSGPETFKELVEVNEAMIDGFRHTLTKLVAIEVNELAQEFGITDEMAQKPQSAFPYLQDQSVEFEESIIEYCAEVIDDLLEVYTIPATVIADDFEEWLNELYEWHQEKRDGTI